MFRRSNQNTNGARQQAVWKMDGRNFQNEETQNPNVATAMYRQTGARPKAAFRNPIILSIDGYPVGTRFWLVSLFRRPV